MKTVAIGAPLSGGMRLFWMALVGLSYARIEKVPSFKTDPYPFVENLGQLADPEGRPLREAYFTFEAPGMRGYLTKWGLSLFFHRVEPDTQAKGEAPDLGDPLMSDREPPRTTIRWERVDVELVGACVEGGRIRKGLPSSWGQNYYLGHCPQGILGVRGYGEVRVERVWPGVDWVLRYDERLGGVKQEFVVQAGYGMDGVRLRVRSLRPVEAGGGRMRIVTKYGEMVEEGLVGYYGSERVEMRYRVLGARQEGEVYVTEVGYEAAGVPVVLRRTLVIDPVLQWGTYFGSGGWDEPWGIEVDGSGNVFVVGWTSSSTGFPLADPGGGAYYDNTHNGTADAFLAKFSGSNLSLLWSTYFGGGSNDYAKSVAVDASGNVFVVGETGSYSGFPLADPGGGAYYDNTHNGTADAFLAKFSGSDLSLLWSTYFGGGGGSGGRDVAYSVAVDGSGNVFVVGNTTSFTDFPLVDPGGGAYYDDSHSRGSYDAFLAKFSGSDLSLVWSTYFGGGDFERASSVAVDGSGNVFVVGTTTSHTGFPLADPGGGAYFVGSYGGSHDAFIAKFSVTNLSLAWSTYFGGGINDYAHSVAVDASGNVFVVGWTGSSTGFPLADPSGGAYYDSSYNGADDLFLAKFSGTNLSLVWSTYYGGGGTEYVSSDRAIRTGAGFIAMVALSNTTNGTFPVGNHSSPCSGGFYQSTHGGSTELAILTFDLNGVPIWRTFYGGSAQDGSPSAVALYSTYLYVMFDAYGSLPATHLPDPGGGAYYDGSHNGSWDPALLRFDYANCPFYYGTGVEEVKAEGVKGSWQAWWDGAGVRLAGVAEPGWYSLMGVDGRVVGRWYVSGGEGELRGSWSPGLYVVHEERSGEARRVWVGP